MAYSATEVLSIEAPQVETIDTTRAGNAFAAGLVHGLVSGRPMGEAVQLGCAYGAEATRGDTSMLPAQAVTRLLAQSGFE
jgi:sugar/nucleoside kinase (ribokinase family)